jgi:serine/threonine-protein kinase RsbT
LAGRKKALYDVATEVRVPIQREGDIVLARQRGRELAKLSGFSSTDQTLVATAISEVARNIVAYATSGEVVLHALEEQGRRGIMVVARDEGPGISDTRLAMQDGYSTAKSLGLGLPGAKRIMDEFDLDSVAGRGTVITMKKWVR